MAVNMALDKDIQPNMLLCNLSKKYISDARTEGWIFVWMSNTFDILNHATLSDKISYLGIFYIIFQQIFKTQRNIHLSESKSINFQQ